MHDAHYSVRCATCGKIDIRILLPSTMASAIHANPIYHKPRAPKSAPGFDYSTFKIAPHQKDILDMINDHSVSAVSAQTGSGKTLFLPWALAKTGKKVRVALPFTVSTRSAYNFQKKYSSLMVGFAAAREVRYSKTSGIVYATTGHFTTKLLHIIKHNHRTDTELTSEMFSFLGDVFVVDEVHSGTVQITLLVGLLNYIRTRVGSFHTHIVFTSATLNHSDVQRHFPEFPTYNVDLARLPITHIYMETERDVVRDDPTDHIIRYIRHELREMERKQDMWHIIVFRPGVQEVEELLTRLERTFGMDTLCALPVYSELSNDDIQCIFEDYGMPKVIIGTNIIESSVTVDGVGAIINDGLVKRVYTNDTGGQKLVTTVVSQAEATQRAGRTARTRPGTAYHLYTERYHEALDEHHPPEIDRVPIHTVTLSCIDAGLVPKDILGIMDVRQQRALETLINMGMIRPDPKGETMGTVTDAGNFVSHVNLGIYNAYMIYLAVEQYQGAVGYKYKGDELVLLSTVALAVMLESYGPPPFYIPRRQRGQSQMEYQVEREVHIEKYFKRFMGSNELETLINVYWTMTDEVYLMTEQQHRLHRVQDAHVDPWKEWAKDNSMNNKKLREFRNTMRPVLQAVATKLRRPELLEDIAPPAPEEEQVVSNAAIDLFKQAYVQNIFTLTSGKNYQSSLAYDHKYYTHGTKTYCTGRSTEYADTVIAAQIMEIQDARGGTRNIIGLTVPV